MSYRKTLPTSEVSNSNARRSVGTLLCTLYVSIALFLFAPHSADFPAALVSCVVFALAPMALPHLRPLRGIPISPLNCALVLFFLQLVVIPLLLCYFGPFQWVLPTLPDDSEINQALFIQILAYMGFACGYQICSRGRSAASRSPRLSSSFELGNHTLLIFAGLGLAGLLFTFRSASSLATYFTQPQSRSLFAYQSAQGWTGLLGILFRPFLGIAGVAWWCRLVDRGTLCPGWRRRVSTFVLFVFILAIYGTYSYNRAAFAAPLVAVAAVYIVRLRKISTLMVLLAAIIGLTGLTALQAYRNASVDAAETLSSSARQQTNLNTELQGYASGPQFLAYLIAQRRGEASLWGRGMLADALSPVPVLGKQYRAVSDTAIYNQMIYGNSSVKDQVVPLQGELIMNFGIPSVPLGFALVGALIATLETRFRRARTALQIYVWQYTAVWCSFLIVGSIEVVSQILVYFFLPLYVLALMNAVRPDRSRGSAESFLDGGFGDTPVMGE